MSCSDILLTRAVPAARGERICRPATATHGGARRAAPTRSRLAVGDNELLSTSPGTFGGTAGWRTRAGGCQMAAAARGDRFVLGVVPGSPSTWSDIPALPRVSLDRLG